MWCAWLVPLTILPRAIWRVSLLSRDGRPVASIEDVSASGYWSGEFVGGVRAIAQAADPRS